MATTRFNLIQWADDTEFVDRTQFNDAFASIDNKAAGFVQTGSAAPSPASDYASYFHFDTSTDTLSYSDGTDWHQVLVDTASSFGTAQDLASSATSSDGVSSSAARSDHVHGIPNSTITDAMLATGISASKITGTLGSVDTGGNAATATAWATGRTISLTGDATGTSGTFDGTGNASIPVTLAANSVDSAQYVDGSIDTIHIGNSQITLAKMAANSVDSAQYVDGSIDNVHINSVDGSKVTGTVANATNATNATTATNVAIGSTTDTTAQVALINGTSSPQAIKYDTALDWNGSTNTLTTTNITVTNDLDVGGTCDADAFTSSLGGISVIGTVDGNGGGTFGSGTQPSSRVLSTSDTDAVEFLRNTSTATDGILVLSSDYVVANGSKFIFRADGTADKYSGAGDWEAISDDRLKEKGAALDSQGTLEALLTLEPTRYRFVKGLNPDAEGNHEVYDHVEQQPELMGFLASNFQRAFPELVKVTQDEEQWRFLSVGQYDAVLTAAIKGLSERVEDLTARLEAVEAS